MTLSHVEFLISTIALIFTYAFSVTIVGSGQAFCARLAGDDTAADEGFLSGNPLNYVDAIGFICIVLTGFGWGRSLPFRPQMVEPPRKSLRVFLVYMSSSLFSLLIALCALVLNVFLIGPNSLHFAVWNIFSQNIPLQQLTKAYPDSSSLLLVGSVLLLSCISLNIFMATWNFINNGFHFILYLGAEHGYNYMKYAEALAFFGPLVILLFFAGPLRLAFLSLLVHAAQWISFVFGVL